MERTRRTAWSLVSVLVVGGLAVLGLLSFLGFLSSLSYAGSSSAAFGPGSSPSLEPRRQDSGSTASHVPTGFQPPGLRRLTSDGQSTPLTWTPDGQTVLIKRPGETVGMQRLSELWALSVPDGDEQVISRNAFSPSISDTQVAYLRFDGEGRWQAVVTELTGRASLTVGTARWGLPPTWMGASVHYLGSSGRLVAANVLHPGEKVSAPLSRLSLGRERARLAPGGRAVAATDGRNLWVSDEHGSIPVARADQVWAFTWSPSGRQLAYVLSSGGPSPELWIWDSEAGSPRMLVRGESEHFGAPAWSPDERALALSRAPTGAGPNATADIWLVRVDGSQRRPLALTPSDEHSPCWSPDGRSLAFSMGGDVWIADLDAPALGSALRAASRASASGRNAAPGGAPPDSAAGFEPASAGWTAPPTILVMHDADGNSCRSVPDGQIDEIPFEEYVKRVVPYEVYTSWPAETLKAQAVAARTYGWRKWLDFPTPPYTYTVKDSTVHQYMCDATYASTNAAVDDTRGQYVSYDGKVIYAFFCAEAGTPTNYQNQFPSVPYLRPVDDPVSFGQTRWGHSWGMSQWGAYRWAAWHNWTYQQILAHYYTSASVERSTGITQSLVSLAAPWSDFCVSADQAHLQATAAEGTLTVAFAARITDTWDTIYTDTVGSDGWGAVWSVRALSDTVTPSLALRATAYGGAGQVVTSTPNLVCLNRTAPTGTVSVSPTEVATLALSLNVTATDPSPTGHPIQVSIDEHERLWEDTDLYRSAGALVTDASAGDGSAWYIGAGVRGVLFGPYTTVLPADRSYRAYFRLRVPTTALTSSLELAKLDVALGGGSELLGVRYVRGTDFRAGAVYQEPAVDFHYPEDGGEVEFRTDSFGTHDLWVDRVDVVSYPVEASPEISWTLPAREGGTELVARFVDTAGNVSDQTTVAVTVTDRSPPGDWSKFLCAGWTCAVQVRDAIAGLDLTSAAYRHSQNGGLSWSEWLTATASGAPGSHHLGTLTADLPLSAHATDRIQFRIADLAAATNVGSSPEYQIRRVYLPLVILR